MNHRVISSLDDLIDNSDRWVEDLETLARMREEPVITLTATQAITLRALALKLRREELMDYRDRIANHSRRDWSETGRCRHGNYTGDPYGPDHMCGTCEDMSREQELELLDRRIEELGGAQVASILKGGA